MLFKRLKRLWELSDIPEINFISSEIMQHHMSNIVKAEEKLRGKGMAQIVKKNIGDELDELIK